jgi:hypothetical protein
LNSGDISEKDLVERYNIESVKTLKIDAEGHDKDILKTLTNTITQHKPVLITEIYNGLNPNEITDLLDTIHSLGYKAYDEEINHLDLNSLGKEIQSVLDINPNSGHNLVCIYGS